MAGMEIAGKFEIYSGDKLVARGRNKWTRFFMSSLMQTLYNSACGVPNVTKSTVASIGRDATSRVGTNTSIETTPDMTDLVSKIDIAPSSVTRKAWKDVPAGLYVAEFVFTWNAGVLPDTEIGELGVYLNLSSDAWESPQANSCLVDGSTGNRTLYIEAGSRLGARVASADGAFSPFYHYGSVEPLTFVWRFQVIIL